MQLDAQHEGLATPATLVKIHAQTRWLHYYKVRDRAQRAQKRNGMRKLKVDSHLRSPPACLWAQHLVGVHLHCSRTAPVSSCVAS